MRILEDIVRQRRERLKNSGYAMGCAIPEQRVAPLTPFLSGPPVICEIKRKSPSSGAFAPSLDPVDQAGIYAGKGIKSISVLTEQDAFSGSLEDLMRAKKAFPEIAFLRKDFLLEEEDIRVSWRAGADAVLLIAGILEKEKLRLLHDLAQSLGLAVLVEGYGREDLDKIRFCRPPLTGFNARDLKTFRIDLVRPFRQAAGVDWETKLIFESGIHSGEEAKFVFQNGFDGILVGEAAVRNPHLPEDLKSAAREKKANGFWKKLYRKKEHSLVKICGLTRRADAEKAAEWGADALGFIFVEHSPRKTDREFLESVKDISLPKVAVTASRKTELSSERLRDLRELYEEGLIDAVQFSGEENLAFCLEQNLPFYKALRFPKAGDVSAEVFSSWKGSPRLLTDTFSPHAFGGTGQTVSDDILEKVRGELLNAGKPETLWMAGGLSPENVGKKILRYRPELVDVAGGVEAEPGLKDPERLKLFLEAVRKASRHIEEEDSSGGSA